MNADTLQKGRAVLSTLRQVSDVVSSWVADLGPDPWPGRRDSALATHSKLQVALQDARSFVGELTATLAQDEAP